MRKSTKISILSLVMFSMSSGLVFGAESIDPLQGIQNVWTPSIANKVNEVVDSVNEHSHRIENIEKDKVERFELEGKADKTDLADKADKTALESLKGYAESTQNRVGDHEREIQDLKANKADKTELEKVKSTADEAKTLAEKADERSSDNKFAITELKKNKADATETKEALEKLTGDLQAEAKDRKADTKLINAKADKNEKSIQALNEDKEEIERRLDGFEPLITQNSEVSKKNTERLGKHDQKLQEYAKKIEKNESELNATKLNLNDLDSKKVDKEIFNSFVAETDAAIETNANNITKNREAIKTNAKGIEKSSEAIKGLEAKKADRAELKDYAKKTDIALANNSQDIMENRAAIHKLDKKVEKTGALSAALAGLKGIAYNPAKPTQIMGAVSSYKGAHAYALGVGHYTSEDLMVHGGLAFTSTSDTMVNLGATIRVGSGNSAPVMSRDSDIMKLQQEMKAMKMEHEKEMKAMKEAFDKLASTMKK